MKKMISVLVICLLSTGCATTVGRWVGGGVLTGLGTAAMAVTPVVYATQAVPARATYRSDDSFPVWVLPLVGGLAMTISGIVVMATRSDEQKEHYNILENLNDCGRRAMKICKYDGGCYRELGRSMCKRETPPPPPVPTCYSIFLECKKDKKCYEQNYYKCSGVGSAVEIYY